MINKKTCKMLHSRSRHLRKVPLHCIALLCLMLWGGLTSSLSATVEVNWTKSSQFNVVWVQNMGAYKITIRYFDYGSNNESDNWASRAVIYENNNVLLAIDSYSQPSLSGENWAPIVRIKTLRDQAAIGKVWAGNYSSASNSVWTQIPYLNGVISGTINQEHGWYNFRFPQTSGTVAYTAEIYWCPNANHKNDKKVFKVVGQVHEQNSSRTWSHNDTYNDIIECNFFEYKEQNFEKRLTDGEIHLNGHILNLNNYSCSQGRATLQTRLPGGTWIDRDLRNCSGGDRWFNFKNAAYWARHTNTSSIQRTSQEFANGIYARVKIQACPDGPIDGSGTSPYVQTTYSPEFFTGRISVIERGSLKMSQTNRQLKLSWKMIRPTGGETITTPRFIIEKKSGATWTQVATVTHTTSTNNFEYNYNLSDAEVNQGASVSYEFRVRQDVYSAILYDQFLSITNKFTVNTQYKNIDISKVEHKKGTNNALLTRTHPDDGIWDNDATIYLRRSGMADEQLSNTDLTKTILNLSSCSTYDFQLVTLIGGQIYYTSDTVNFSMPNINARDVTDFEASKGYYNDNVTLRWNVPSNKSDFTYFTLSREPVSGGTRELITQMQHINLTSYSYQDRDMQAGVIYNYILEGYSDCNGTISNGGTYMTEGFCQPYGVVSGRISYGGNQGVPGVTVSILGNSSNSLSRSVLITEKTGSYVNFPGVLNLDEHRNATFQAWINPSYLVNDTTVIMDNDALFSLYLTASGVLVAKVGGVRSVVSNVVLSKDQWQHLTVGVSRASATATTATITVYLDGKLKATRLISAMNTALITAKKGSVARLGQDLANSRCNKLYMDEIRFWSMLLDSAEVASSFDRLISGKESNLEIYYRCDEPDVKKLFDLSAVGRNFNKRDATLGDWGWHSLNMPSSTQLSIKATTDTDGNYLINTVPYTTDGLQYSVVPTMGVHAFNPSQQPIFASSSSSVFNAVNFTDVSSFAVTGAVYYEHTDYPVEGANLYIDGVICSKDGEAVVTNVRGEYEISVPIGEHHITVKKAGHTFVNDGRYPSDPDNIGSKITFDREVTNLNFKDNTLVTLVGRVVGGKIESDKPFGMGLSENNIGRATLVLSAGNYRMNVVDQITGTVLDVVNNLNNLDVPSPTEDVKSVSYRRGGNGAAVQQIQITTDSLTGEFAVLLPPVSYKVESINIGSNNSIVFNKESISLIDLTNPLMIRTDSIEQGDSIKRFKYCKNLVLTHFETPQLEVEDADNKHGAFGSKTFVYRDVVANVLDTLSLFSYDEATGVVTYPYSGNIPLFLQGNDYSFKLKAYERYVNNEQLDIDGNAKVSIVPLQDVGVSVTNQMSAAQGVYVEDGVTADNDTVSAGDFGSLNPNYIVLDSLGEGTYRWKAGFPNIISPYQMGMTIYYNYNGSMNGWSENNNFKGIVLGELPSGNNFVTSGPDKVLMILRDPAGTGSSSFWEEGVTVTTEEVDGGSFISNNEITTETKFGAMLTTIAGTPGFGVVTEAGIENTLEVGIHVNGTRTSTDTWTTTITTTNKISTSPEFDFVGADADVFIGAATNVIFGNARQVSLTKALDNSYSIDRSDVMTAGSEFSTSFSYTANYIENVLIPNLTELRNSLLITVTQGRFDSLEYSGNSDVMYVTTLDKTDDKYGSRNFDNSVWGSLAVSKTATVGPSYKMLLPQQRIDTVAYQDKVLWYNEQIKGWEAALESNEIAKVEAIENRDKWLHRNYSFDVGAIIESSVSNCTGRSTAVESEVEILAVLGLQTGFEINKTGVAFTAKTETGGKTTNSSTSGTETCNVTGFSFVEDGDDDALTIDVFNAPDGFGAIFRTRGGQTSCPYEDAIYTKYHRPGFELSRATMRIEWPKIDVVNNRAINVPVGKNATYTIQLSNLSETDEDVWFTLAQLDETNPDGARITIDGAMLTDGRNILVRANEVLTKTLHISQTRLDVMDYDSIQIVLKSQCQADPTAVHAVIADTITLFANFIATCSDVDLRINNRVINTQTSDTLAMQVSGYSTDFNNFQYLYLQCKSIADDSWLTLKKYAANDTYLASDNELLPQNGSFTYLVPMSNNSLFPDQTYLFRAVTVCGPSANPIYNESETIEVVKDMAYPLILGTPTPSNGILGFGDDISITFNEPIRQSILTSTSNFLVTGLLNDAQIAHSVAAKLEQAAQPLITDADIRIERQSFAFDTWLNYTVGGVLFSHGNGQNKFVVSISNNGIMQLTVGNQTYTSTNTVPLNKWVFVTFNYTYDASQCLFSAMVAEDANTINLFNSLPVVAYTGYGKIALGANMEGAIHETTLWNRARTVTEAQSGMYNSKAASTPNLIGYWKLDEGDGLVATDYARNRHMALSSNSWYLNNENIAVDMDGSTYIALDISRCPVDADDDYAYEMWFKAGAQADTAMLFSIGNRMLALGFAPNGNMIMINDNVASEVTTTNYLDNTWHHVALNVLRNGNAIVYVDGVNVKQQEAARVNAMSAARINLGARSTIINLNNTAYDQYFTGSIDEVRLWKARLTADVIRNQCRHRLLSGAAGLVAYYPFEFLGLSNGQVVVTGSLLDHSKDYPVDKQLFAIANKAISYSNNAPALKEAPNAVNVPFTFVASDNTIVINLSSSPEKLEGCNINLVVRNVQDLNNNWQKSDVIWNVYVQQNQLKWVDTEVSVKQESGTESNFTAQISNLSGKTESWSLVNVPSWLTVNAYGGAIPALSNATLNFTVSSALPIGNYEAVVYLVGDKNIHESLIISVHVTGVEPNWDVDPSQFETSMNIIAQLQIASLVSEDPDDKVAAFVDGICVGVASPTHYSRYDSYYVMMDVYGNAKSANKPVSFKVWDASTGIIYPVVSTSETVTYMPNQLVGNMRNPLILNAEDKVEQSLDLVTGWNWSSFNAQADDMTVRIIMGTIQNSLMMIKGKTAFAVPAGNVWAGSLSEVEIGKMYKIQMREDANLTMTGEMVDPTTATITVLPNWNWLGYTPNYNLSVADAFANLSPEDGDQVKGQTGFALYQDYEWVGTLKALIPGKGYMYQSKAAASKNFTYPSSSFATRMPQRSPRANTTFTPVEENAYSGNMTLVGVVKNLGAVVSNCEVGVFVGNECRAAEVTDENGMVYLTIAGEGAGDLLNFRVVINGATTELTQTLVYNDDNTVGTLDNPYALQLVATGMGEVYDNDLQVYPTRVIEKVFVVSSYMTIKSIKVMDANGRLMQNIENVDDRNAECLMSTYSPGVYLIVVETEDGNVHTFKVVKAG